MNLVCRRTEGGPSVRARCDGPELFTIVGTVGVEAAVRVALEHEVTRRREYTAVEWQVMADAPASLAPPQPYRNRNERVDCCCWCLGTS